MTFKHNIIFLFHRASTERAGAFLFWKGTGCAPIFERMFEGSAVVRGLYEANPLQFWFRQAFASERYCFV